MQNIPLKAANDSLHVFIPFIHVFLFLNLTTLYNVKHNTEKWNHWIKLGAARDIKTADKHQWEIKNITWETRNIVSMLSNSLQKKPSPRSRPDIIPQEQAMKEQGDALNESACVCVDLLVH